jgi:hypothetical protein
MGTAANQICSCPLPNEPKNPHPCEKLRTDAFDSTGRLPAERVYFERSSRVSVSTTLALMLAAGSNKETS